jgi:hypothetical protein
MSFDPTNATSAELETITSRLALSPKAKVLPAHWTPWRRPVPPLPIDEYIAILAARKRKPLVRSPDVLSRFRLGKCPYAVARSGVAQAISFATFKQDIESLRALTTSKLRDLKTELPALESALLSAIKHITSIGSSQELHEELDFGNLLILQNALLAALVTVEHLMPEIRALHLERSRHRGNLWRQSFVGSLFYTWWILTDSDPSSSSAPFLEFVEACWSSLSPNNLPEVSWESAVDSALGRGSKRASWWRGESHLT